MFLWNVLVSWARGAEAGNDPWLGNTLEWLTTSPPPAYNFASLPRIRSERPLRDLRLAALADERLRATAAARRRWRAVAATPRPRCTLTRRYGDRCQPPESAAEAQAGLAQTASRFAAT